jgi:23S rRNA pseudouridine1911/1915/1917 synthase
VADTLDLEVPERLEGQRVDKVLADLLDLSRAQARALLDTGVLLDGSPARPSDRVHTGAVVVSPMPEVAIGLIAEPVDFRVIHEDPEMIVVDKPAGLVVHPGSGHERLTLAAGLLHRYPELEGVGAVGRWGLIHRLDRDTSGVLVVGRTASSFERLNSDMARRRIRRLYKTLVHGTFATPTGTIDAPIGRDPDRPTRRAVVPGGKPAVTHYEVIEELESADVSLLEVALGTGRTHQIRVHMTAIDHPIVGDKAYSSLNKAIESPRIFLHANQVSLHHPATGEEVTFTSPLPSDLAEVLDFVRSKEEG